MPPGWFAAVSLENQDAAIREAGVAVAEDRCAEGLVDQVVGVQRVMAQARLIEDVEHVLAVRRAQDTLEEQVVEHCFRQIETLVLAGLQVIATGKDDAVIFRQLDAGDADGVDAGDALRTRVIDQIAYRLLAVGLDAQQDQQAETGVGYFGVVERLSLVFDRFAVDAQSAFSVVLDLDRQVAADGFDEDGVENIDVRMTAADLVFAPGRRPFEIMARRQRHVALAAIVDIAQRAVVFQAPAENAQVVQLLADLKGGEQFVLGDAQLSQRRLLVVGVQFAEIGHETLVFKEAAG